MAQGEIDLGNFLPSFYEQTKRKLLEYRDKYPVLHDYCNQKLSEMDELYKAYGQGGTPEYRKQKVGNLFATCYEVSAALQEMDNAMFPFLYDGRLWHLIHRAMTEKKMSFSHNYVKSMISANLLELTINDTIKKLDPNKYRDLNNGRKGLQDRYNTLQTLLEEHGLEKFKLDPVKFPAVKGIRDIVDHPDLETITNITEDDFKMVAQYTAEAMHKLQQVDGILETQKQKQKGKDVYVPDTKGRGFRDDMRPRYD